MADRLGTRVNLTLPTELVEVLDVLGEATDTGRATFIREWLMQSYPSLAELARAAQLAKARNIDALRVASDALKGAAAQADLLGDGIKSQYRAARRKRVKA